MAGRAPLEKLLAGEPRAPAIDRRVRQVADSTDSRVTLLNWNQSFAGPQGDGRELRFYPLSDSREAETAFPRDDGLARRAVLSEHSRSGFGQLRQAGDRHRGPAAHVQGRPDVGGHVLPRPGRRGRDRDASCASGS